MKRSILIRTDASADIGTGHLMRCLAFAQECRKKGHEPLFVLSMETPLIERLKNEGMTVIRIDAERGSSNDAAKTIAIANDHDAQWILTDGYVFDAAYGAALRSAGHRVLMVDDYAHLLAYDCDILLNQNIDATEEMYADKADVALLLGTRYALLRKEFVEYGDRARKIPDVATNILVTLGGVDPGNATAPILHALDRIDTHALTITVLAGSENLHEDALKKIAAGSKHRITLLRSVTDMPSLMAEADIAIAAAGSTSWELLFMGLPFITGILAENQAGIARELGVRKLAVNAGWYRDIPPESLAASILALIENHEARKRMSDAGKATVDGMGAERVLKAILSRS
ncbi:UDP-2,4-diacetamido-2,4,6-trideoxy-beta-L-altropyranose hydrolase [Candidatus Kaiserbacteria bacterium RIFCSPHIGHO2_01_FULL_53_29]|uniref:UDP-2,4-diacetamido-2,4, 6-trideoxy-beta-L-altropyranose hydrolase n=1 Tax=Candidatus Kaiserbacteria bacterium RIFCSPHIGHO2_01_FULL_53_29 TaxID=1798480 RepID=A0A1F6CVI8_9BACT|nr:MAG: UDP-2,4-diacetamido-2,4,6-trideoxy-beta-L-altropyranose hydrolase [Candidatus Kaiserbacteria bacterium RIFCSPHIGHO2_01_FULL_53_29]